MLVLQGLKSLEIQLVKSEHQSPKNSIFTTSDPKDHVIMIMSSCHHLASVVNVSHLIIWTPLKRLVSCEPSFTGMVYGKTSFCKTL